MNEVSALPIGFCVGVFGTLIGAGGGFLLVPLLVVLEPQWSTQTVTAFSLAVVTANALAGSLSYARLRRIDLASFPIFAAAAIPGAILGAWLTAFIPRRIFDAFLGGFIVVAGLLYVSRRAERSRSSTGVQRKLIDASGIVYEWNVNLPLGILGSAMAGLLSSLLGIGGGVIHVPFLVGILGFPEHVATATSHAVLAVTAGAATILHIIHGDFHEVLMTLLTALGALIGAPFGARLSSRVSGPVLAKILAVALAIVGVRLVLIAAFPTGA